MLRYLEYTWRVIKYILQIKFNVIAVILSKLCIYSLVTYKFNSNNIFWKVYCLNYDLYTSSFSDVLSTLESFIFSVYENIVNPLALQWCEINVFFPFISFHITTQQHEEGHLDDLFYPWVYDRDFLFTFKFVSYQTATTKCRRVF